MANFCRVLKVALHYRWTFAASVICALLVAVFWGGNITAIYPVIDVVFEGRSLKDWIADEVDTAHEKIASHQHDLDWLELQPEEVSRETPTGDGDKEGAPLTEEERQAKIHRAREDIAAEQRHLSILNFIRPPIENYAPNGAFATLVMVIGFLFLGTVLKSVFYVFHVILVSRLAQLATFNLRKEFYRHTLKMDLASIGVDGTHDLMARFTHDVDHLAAGIKILLGKAVREPLKMIACLVGAMLINWRLVILLVVVAPLAAAAIGKLGRMLKRANRRAMEEMSQLYGILNETLQGVKVVKAFTMERYERRRFHQNSKKYYKKAMKIARYDSFTRPLTEVVGMLMLAVVLLIGAYLAIEGKTHLFNIRLADRAPSVATLLLFYGLLAGVSDPARKLTDVFNRVQKSAAAADRIFAKIDRQSKIADPPHPKRPARHHRDITLANVSFGYLADQPVLENIDLTIPHGETIAIVGPNGCGKSTLANLILRFFDPDEGVVAMDGVDLRQMPVRHVRQQIGLVNQETLLFDDTVFQNIRYGSPHATQRDVVAAAEAAYAHRFIVERLEAGYETVVGARGLRLSGGQRQRIALARAMLRDPAILILDEATSQVDIESEHLIHKALERFLRDRTAVIITHRLSTLTLADRIVVMQAGRIIDQGPHAELLGRCDLYRRLHDAEFRKTA